MIFSTWGRRTALSAVAFGLVWALAASCSDKRENNAAIGTWVDPGTFAPEGSGLKVLIAVLPDETTAQKAWAWVRHADGTQGKAVSGPAEIASVLEPTAARSPYDLVAYLPDDPSWTPEAGAAGAGYYAVRAGLSTLGGFFRVVRWTRASAAPATGSGLADGSEDGKTVEVSGRVMGTTGEPIADAVVSITGEAVAFSDKDGTYMLAIAPGAVELAAEALGATTTRQVEVGASGAKGVDLTLEVSGRSPPAPYTLQGRVLDLNTGAGVPGAAVYLIPASVGSSAMTDAQGRFALPGTARTSGVLWVKKSGYAWSSTLQAGLGPGVAPTVRIRPLVERFYGTWRYCHTRMSSGRLVVIDGTVPDTGVRAAQTFSIDGVANILGGSIQGAWQVWELGSKPGTYWPTFAGRNDVYLSWRYWLAGQVYRFEGDLLAHVSTGVTSSNPDQNVEAQLYSNLECPSIEPPPDAGVRPVVDGAAPPDLGGFCPAVSCVTVTGTKRGTHCGSATSLELNYRNGCSYPVAVKYCLYTTAGKWDCGVESNLAPGASGGLGAWTCQSTGSYWLHAMQQTQYVSGSCAVPAPSGPPT